MSQETRHATDNTSYLGHLQALAPSFGREDNLRGSLKPLDEELKVGQVSCLIHDICHHVFIDPHRCLQQGVAQDSRH